MSGERRRILYLNSSGDFYGAERCLLNLTTRLNDAEFSPCVVLPFRGQLYDELQRHSIETRILPLGVLRVRRELFPPLLFRRLAELVPAVYSLVKMIRQEQVAIVHSNTSAVLAGALAARLARVPHVWHVREIITRPAIMWSIMRRLIPILSTRVICISHAVRQHLGDLPSSFQGRVQVIYDGVDVNLFRPDLTRVGVKAAGPLIGMVARVSPPKGHDVFIRAAAKVLEAIPSARFVIVGGYLPEYKGLWNYLVDLRHELGLDLALAFTGTIHPDSIPQILASWDVFVLPTTDNTGFREGLGQVILEAMALAKPVVATNVGGPTEAVVDGVTGYLIPPADAGRLASAVLGLIGDERLGGQMGRAGRARVEQCFTLEQNVQAVEQLYRDMVAFG
jgi:glycosyltransferase involved in cell wall biosynthesis